MLMLLWHFYINLFFKDDEKKSPEKKEKKIKTKSIDLPILPFVSSYSKDVIHLLQEKEVM